MTLSMISLFEKIDRKWTSLILIAVLILTLVVASVVAMWSQSQDIRARAQETVESENETVTFTPDADASVYERDPDTNAGLDKSLEVDGSPVKTTYMRFDLPSFAGKTIQSAILRLKITNSSSSVQNIKLTSPLWNESEITYNNRPVALQSIASLNGGSSGNWVEIDLTSAAKNANVLSFLIDSGGSNGLDFNSKEASSDVPQLVVTYSTSSTYFTCSIDGQPISGADENFVGMAGTHPLIGNTSQLQYAVDLLGEARVKYVRSGINWNALESTKGVFNWNTPDIRLQTLASAGSEPLITLSKIASWANSAGDPLLPPDDINDWKDFVRETVRRYGIQGQNIVHNWEIWNEPDIVRFFSGTPEDYLQLLNTAYEVIKQEDPQAKVWGPTTTRIVDPTHEKFQFTQLAIEQGNMDIFSVHSYGTVQEAYDKVKAIRQRLDDFGRLDLPLAVTETNEKGPWSNGQPCPYSDTYTLEQQAALLTDRYVCLKNAGADSVFWYKIPDTLDPVCSDGVNRDGVLNIDLNSKPAYFALKTLGERFNPLPSPIALTAQADAYVAEKRPNNNYGNQTTLEVDGKPGKITYFEFNIPQQPVTIKNAVLRLKITNSSSSVQNIKLTSPFWNESEITYNNRPAALQSIASLDGGSSGNWVEIDLTTTVQQYVGQTFSILIDSSGNNNLNFKSKEASSEQPQLVISY